MSKLIVSERARKEILISYKWYENKQAGIGEKFTTEIYAAFSKIKLSPERFAVKKHPYHEIPLKKFPFVIIYRLDIKTKDIFISSVFHFNRNPGKKYI